MLPSLHCRHGFDETCNFLQIRRYIVTHPVCYLCIFINSFQEKKIDNVSYICAIYLDVKCAFLCTWTWLYASRCHSTIHEFDTVFAIEESSACRFSHLRIHIDGLVQERRNSSALAMELRLYCTNPSIYKPARDNCYCHCTDRAESLYNTTQMTL